MAEKELKDAVETASRPQIRRSRKKTDTDAGTDQAQMTTTGASEDETETRTTVRRRRTTAAGEKSAKPATPRSTRKKAKDSETASESGQERLYHLLPDAAAHAAAEQKLAEAALLAKGGSTESAPQEKPRRRRRPRPEDEVGIPSISLADELAGHEKSTAEAAQDPAEEAQPADRGEDLEVGSFSSFVAQLNGNKKSASTKITRGRTVRTTRATKQTRKPARDAQAQIQDNPVAEEEPAAQLAEEALAHTQESTNIVSEDMNTSEDLASAKESPASPIVDDAAGTAPQAEQEDDTVETNQPSQTDQAGETEQAGNSEDDPAPGDAQALQEQAPEKAPENAQAPDAADKNVSQVSETADPASGTVLDPASSPASTPVPATEQTEAAPAAPVDPLAHLTPEELEFCEHIAHHVSLQESKASADDDMTPFIAHFQYGDGQVETCVIGASDVPPVFAPADAPRAHNFFRICRHVHVPEDAHATPLPAGDTWIPPHPAPRTSQAQIQAQRAAAAAAAATATIVSPAQVHSTVSVVTPTQAAASAVPVASEAARVGATGPEVSQSAGEAAQGQRKPRILLCWVGKVDISAALRNDTVNPGPIRMLLQYVPPFDYVLLLTAMSQNVQDTLRNWLAPCISQDQLEVRKTAVADLSDHATVCQATLQAMESLIEKFHLPQNGEGITYHLSPGSPVTHAVLLLLATIRYNGVALMQTRLMGLGKEPEILTVSLQDMVSEHAPVIGQLRERLAKSIAEYREAKAAGKTLEAVHEEPETGRHVPLLPRPRHKLKARDLVQRFRTSRKARTSSQAGQTVLQPKIQVVQAPERSLDFDMPVVFQDETSLRAPVPNIGKPSRLAPTAPMPKEGEPPVISAELGDVYRKMQRVATMFVSILLLGESGCGKSRLARYIHEWSGRTGKFVSLDCADLTDDMFYTELFGRAGANVTRPREGAFRKARSGTLFLENVNRLTPTQQSMLVRVLATAGETRLSLPAASPYPACTSRVRVIASALPSLTDDVRNGRFRTDLYYRLAGVSTLLPPVREYTYDERENLLRSFLVALQQKLGQCWNFSGEAWQTLIEERWPGNLREVSRILQQICLLSDADSTISREDVLVQLQQGRVTETGETIHDHHEDMIQDCHFGINDYLLPRSDDEEGEEEDDEDDYDHELENELDELRSLNEKTSFFELGSGENLDDTLSKMRLAKIVEAMDKTNGNRVEAAKLLGLSYVQLNYTLKQLLQNRHKGQESQER